MIRSAPAFLIAATCGLAPLAAHGAAFQLREDSAVNLGTAFAGSASSATGPSTAFDNPAGMTQLPGLQVQLGGSLVAPSYVFHGGSTNAFGRPNAGFDDRDGGNPGFVPHGFVTYRADRLALGLAVTTPFGLDTYYGPGFIGRYQADKTSLETVNINPAVAYQVTPWLSLGAGLSAQYASAEFSTFLNSAALAASALGRPLALPDGHFALHGDNWSFGYNLGALIQPAPGTNIGLSYRSRVQQDFSGSVDFIVPAPLSLSPAFRNGPGTAKLVLPDTASVSVTQRLGPQWTAYGELSWTNWSQFKNLNAFRADGTLLSSTPERYRNSVFVSVGASYALNDQLTVRGGFAYDKSPITDAYRTSRVPDNDRYWLAAGVSYRILANTAVDLGYAHIFVPESTIREVSATGDVLTGRYTSSVDIVSLGTRFSF